MFELLTAQEAAELLKLRDPKTAKRKLAEWGVQPYFIGRGRGAGYRYRKDEIYEALEKTRVSPRQARKRRPGRKERTILDDVSEGTLSAKEAARLIKTGSTKKQ